ncbi:MOGS glucosidase, partial [Chordeiles acutipennis]|nr:MOGS glucosidase [Chordeiles acutipennis]
MAAERRRRGLERNRERGIRRERDLDQQRETGRNWTVLVVAVTVLTVGLAFAVTEWNRWHETSRLVTPHPAPPALLPGSTGALASPQWFWGTYRPHVYFGMKTRSPRSLVTGFMWLQQAEGARLRHGCEQDEPPARYGWVMHDGESFGVQEIREGNLLLRTEFVKRGGGEHGGDWSWRVSARPEVRAAGPVPLLSLFFYVATDGQGSLEPQLEEGTRLAAVTGATEELGNFTVTFLRPTAESGGEEPRYARCFLPALAPAAPSDPPLSVHPPTSLCPPLSPDPLSPSSDSLSPCPHTLPLSPDVLLPCHPLTPSLHPLMSPDLLSLSPCALSIPQPLSRRFEATFGLSRKGFPGPQRRFAQAALSELLGGVGYFHGRSLLRSPPHEQPVPAAPAALFTAVPSRSFFPRGFLWDEGFHQLLLGRWDAALSREMIAHWLDLMNAEGWIPREQILGDEARARVPPEFVVQRSDTANPPTLLLALGKLLPGAPLPYLRRLFPRLRAWYEWFQRTQAGPLPHTYRWRGRDPPLPRFLNPRTLGSGLDDYPRASHPSAHERHLDLRCWMALAARVLRDVAERLGEPAESYREAERALSDNELLDELHWAPELGAFADYGNHSTAVGLRWHRPPPPAPGHPAPEPQLVREVREAPRLRFVEALGYVSLFPLLLQLLRPDSPRLPALLAAIRSERQLWTPYGLRSLSRDSPFYRQHNTQHDPPYWRGAVWVNLNYLALRALRGYAEAEGPERERAAEIYRELRENLVRNLYREHGRSGFLWESYSDSSGRGQGCRPFAGWSALVVLVMAEDY